METRSLGRTEQIPTWLKPNRLAYDLILASMDSIMTLREQIRSKLLSYAPRKIHTTDRIPAAVIVPFFEKQGEPHLLFTKRTDHLQYHGGEISFPGGAREA